MGTVQAYNPGTGQMETYSELEQLHQVIAGGEVEPRRDDGEPMRVQELEGTYLLDGIPINVLIEEEWLPGQREALEPYWASGEIPRPDPDMDPLPPGGGTIAGIPTWVVGLAALAGVWYLWPDPEE